MCLEDICPTQESLVGFLFRDLTHESFYDHSHFSFPVRLSFDNKYFFKTL